MTALLDHADILLARQGHRPALDRLIARHYETIYRLALRLTGDADRARDVTQDTFLQFCRALRRVDAARSVEPYLKTIALNRVRDWLRHKALDTRARVAAAAMQPSAIAEPESENPLPEYARSALASLPPHLRTVVELKWERQMTFQEIADHLQISINTAMSRMRYAREALRRSGLLARSTSAELPS